MSKPETPEIYDQLKAAGVPLDNHESDLYAKVCDESRRILKGYQFRGQVTMFQSNTDGGALWFDVPFAFKPFWDRVAARQSARQEAKT